MLSFRAIAERKRPIHGGESVFETLYKDAHHIDEELLRKRREKDEEEMRNCTFFPKTNENNATKGELYVSVWFMVKILLHISHEYDKN